MRGKYSPTVSAAYRQNQDWWRKYTGEDEFTYHQYDPEGYDSYGYNKDDVDRAGNDEFSYIINDSTDWFDDSEDYNIKYNQALEDWTFNGVKPVRRENV